MLDFKSDFLCTLNERGFFYQGTNVEKLDELCCHGVITGYIGFDATAKSLQVGNLSAIMLLRWLQKFGHTPLVLVGGGTSRIGDPSFRNVARPVMSIEQIQENINGITKVFAKLINLDSGSNKGQIVNNLDWLGDLKYIDFLRDYGCHFTVNRMLSFDSIKSRLEKEEPLSFLEFNYMIMQAYDFYYLYKNFDCILQMGGSDQWGNIVNGVDLTKRLTGADVFGVTAPLVTDASGVKMGKTRDGAVWLNPEMLAPFEYWQFWRNTDDQDVIRFLKKFTELPMDEIRKLSSLRGEEINESKKVLADEATALLHGRDVLDEIHETAAALFGSGGGSSSAIPCIFFDKSNLPISIGDLFVFSGLCDSKSSFKRAVDGKGVYFQSEIINDAGFIVEAQHFSGEDGVLLSFGKKKHIRVKSR
jgi:tyrosyl-tRNA synthetase